MRIKKGGRWNVPLPEADSAGGWPSDDAAAKAMWQEQEAVHGCPLQWLFDLAQAATEPYTPEKMK